MQGLEKYCQPSCFIVITALIFAVCTTSLGADNHTRKFRVPDPEEIYEAFSEGFIEYQDYRELLEISRADFLAPGDSAYLLQFPDLLAGFLPGPLGEHDVLPESAAQVEEKKHSAWQQSFLIRQYCRLNHNDQRKQVYRLRGQNRRWSYYGEIESEYSGYSRWSRRYLQYGFLADSASSYIFTVGNYKERFGMGLIYGYHGQLLSKSPERDNEEKFLYSNYGGGNGILLTAGRSGRTTRILYDTDRNEELIKNLVGISMPIGIPAGSFELSAVHGKLRSYNKHASVSTSLISISGKIKKSGIRSEFEIAGAAYRGRVPLAAMANIHWRKRNNTINAIGWTYAENYPAFFSGGPSSRRSHTLQIDELDFSYSDRYSGESGTAVKTSSPLTDRLTVRSTVTYARRAFDDDRVEARVGLRSSVGGAYEAKIDCYWRGDDLYSNLYRQRRVQIEIIKHGETTRARLAAGPRSDTRNGRSDWLVVAEGKYRGSWGTAAISCKFDRLHPDDMKNDYMYLAGYYETDMGRYFHSYIKYTYRYRRGEPESSYGTVRLDIGWVIE